jgi:hypothetical protein
VCRENYQEQALQRAIFATVERWEKAGEEGREWETLGNLNSSSCSSGWALNHGSFYLLLDFLFDIEDGRTTFFLVPLGRVRLSPLGTSASVGLLYQPRMKDDDYGAVGGMRIGRGTEVLGGNLRQCHFVHHKSHTN